MQKIDKIGIIPVVFCNAVFSKHHYDINGCLCYTNGKFFYEIGE